MRSATEERAFAAAAEHDYTGQRSRALLWMAGDADHDTGENSVTSVARVHEAAGYPPDPTYGATRRTIQRFLDDGVIRLDVDEPGIGRIFTVCPVGPWSGVVSTKSALGRKIAAKLASRGTPESGGHPGLSGVRADSQESGVPDRALDSAPDSAPDSEESSDQRTSGPTDQLLTAQPAREIADILDGASKNGSVDRQAVERLIAEHPGKPHRAAALEVVAWSKREPLRSVIAAYRRALADSPDTPAPPPEPEPPSASDTAAWDAARERLRERLRDSDYAIWIEPLTLLGGDGDELVIGAPAALAGWVRDRFEELLDDALGRPWRIDSLARGDGERAAS